MFNRLTTYFKNIFLIDHYNNYQNKPIKEQYIDRALQKAEVDMYTEFPFVRHIPQKRIYIIKKEYGLD